MDEEIEVAPSADNGNVPDDAPSQQPQEPAPVVEPEQPAVTPEPELFELPDGRKVDGASVAQEYKNLLSDYTKKSQTLSQIEKGNTINQPTEKPYEKPDWQPQTYNELIQVAKQEIFGEMQAKEQAKINADKALEDAVATQLTELKATDSALNENALFLHATKYGFRDLKAAHQNMKDFSDVAKKAADTTAKNIAKRNDPVSVTPGAGGQKLDASQFATARDYLRALKGGE